MRSLRYFGPSASLLASRKSHRIAVLRGAPTNFLWSAETYVTGNLPSWMAFQIPPRVVGKSLCAAMRAALGPLAVADTSAVSVMSLLWPWLRCICPRYEAYRAAREWRATEGSEHPERQRGRETWESIDFCLRQEL